jgi:hypothetical protein
MAAKKRRVVMDDFPVSDENLELPHVKDMLRH